MTNTKFVVKVIRGRYQQYVRRLDRAPRLNDERPLARTPHQKTTAEDVVHTIQNPRCSAELVHG